MIKKLSTLLIAACMAAPSMAQTIKSNDDGGALYAPQKGQWQVSVFFGGASTFYHDDMSFLVPQYNNIGGYVGIQGGNIGIHNNPNGINSGELQYVLNLSGIENNSLTNIVGLEGRYFLTDRWDLNMQFSMNINLTPSKDYVEADKTIKDMVIPAQAYINAQMTNNWYLNLGSNYNFRTRNERIHPYLGAAVGLQMARIEINQAYTGDMYDDEIGDSQVGTTDPSNPSMPNVPGNTDTDNSGSSWNNGVSPEQGLPEQVYCPGGRAGQMIGLRAAAVAGIEYSLAKGLVLGFQFQPFSYRYDIIQIAPQGFDKYNANHHNIKIFDMPMLKLGFRF